MLGVTPAAGGGGSDPSFANVSFLCHFDGTNGGTTFTDQKSHAITRNGSILLSSTHAKFGATSGQLISASSQYLTCAASADFNLGSGDWTIEAWVYFATGANGTTQYLCDLRPASTGGTYPEIGFESAGQIRFLVGGTQQIIGTGGEFATAGSAINNWVHVAACKSSGSTKLFVSGSQVGSTFTDSNTYGSSAQLFIGASSFANGFLNAWVDDFRITKGVARYTSNFTPPSAAFPDS